jgi:putative ABC transport system substrate-binding protein
LNEAGFVEKQNLLIEYRWADFRYDRLPVLAADLVARRVDVIFTTGGVVSALAAKAATTTIPIVFANGSDPVQSGLVASLSRPPPSPLTMLLSRHTKRREFIALLGGAAAAWPLAARSQQSAMPVIGFLRPYSIERSMHLMTAFRQGLKEAGYTEGQNVVIEYRSAEGQYDRLTELATDLVQRRVQVIIATGGSGPALAAKSATSTIPIVFTGEDPVKAGLVASLNQPGGNATGVSTLSADIGSKRLGLLHELVPNATTIAVLNNPKFPGGANHLQEVQSAARSLGLQMRVLNAVNEGEIDAAFVAMARERPDALLQNPDPFMTSRRDQIVTLANHYKLPALYQWREFADVGGLASYGPSHTEPYRLVGIYTGRILKGAKPSDLPVVQSAKFELVINLRTAKSLGIEIPPTLLARADEVIE